MKVFTEYHAYASRWTAVDEDTYDGAPDGGGIVGEGKTEMEAINDLYEQMGLIPGLGGQE